jgi:hypothetical protein
MPRADGSRRVKPRTAVKKISDKRLAKLGGKVPYSTIEAKPKPIKKQNPERAAKRKASYRKKLAAYRKSETYKVVQQRAAGRCEFTLMYTVEGWSSRGRCDETKGLQHHHKTYARFGGDELPEDIEVLCKTHHEWIEGQHATRRHGR